MSNQIALTTEYIKGLTPIEVLEDKAIGEHFVNKFMAVYRTSKDQAVAYYEREIDNFTKRVNESEDLAACTPMSLFVALMQVGGWKLSFEGGSQSEVYLIPGNRKVVIEGKEVWIKEAVAQPSPYGEKKIRVETRQIRHVGNPTVVYECDQYSESVKDGRTMVDWTKGKRDETSRIVGGFILLEYPDGSKEFKTYDMNDVASWEKASEKKNKGKANALYGWGWVGSGASSVYKKIEGSQIDKKFFEGKILKHAFKLFPRVIANQTLPENFVPSPEVSVREGFDMSEFTEDVTHEDLTQNEQDDFDQALKEAESESQPQTVTVSENVDDDEPTF
ncbi:recombinase RecT [Pedobacter agri]|uniref:Recombinase RecT n=1 Tax=Pedobacter agri TaxID=454586 RepID=A0A9X3DBW4_9SPHI|nr:recombinase RecT [Pedobacter agri]MCX3264784.1 recombinase RecT [Pedobacter agri]